jgi:hypothetical protein
MIRLLTIAAAAVTVGVLAVATSGAAQKKPVVQCMTDDGYGRYRPCSALYKREHPNWKQGTECMTDDGYGRYRPCNSLYWQGSSSNPGQYGTNSTFPKPSKQQPF